MSFATYMIDPTIVGAGPSCLSLYHNREELLISLKMNANETIYSANVPNVCQKYINGAVRLPATVSAKASTNSHRLTLPTSPPALPPSTPPSSATTRHLRRAAESPNPRSMAMINRASSTARPAILRPRRSSMSVLRNRTSTLVAQGSATRRGTLAVRCRRGACRWEGCWLLGWRWRGC